MGSFLHKAMTRLDQMMRPDFTDPRNMQPGALGMLPGMGVAMGIGMAIHGIGEAFGIEVGMPETEDERIARETAHGEGAGMQDPPIAPEDQTDSPQRVLTPEEEQERLRLRGLQWYSGLMAGGLGSAPGA